MLHQGKLRVVTLCDLRAPTDGYCASCFQTNQFCGMMGASGVSPGPSLEQRFSDNQRKTAFLNIVEGTRKPWDPHRGNQHDTEERRKEKSHAAQDRPADRRRVRQHCVRDVRGTRTSRLRGALQYH